MEMRELVALGQAKTDALGLRRKRWDTSPQKRPATSAAARQSTYEPYRPCTWEGPIVEYCTGCQGEWKHVRLCLYDGPADVDWEKCVRGESKSPEVASCSLCRLRQTG